MTIFTTPRGFSGETGRRQRVAIASWRAACPSAEIVLVGNDPGVAQVCREVGAAHIPDVALNDRDKPLRGDVFRRALQAASHEWLCFISADIVLRDDVAALVPRLPSTQALAIGRRTDVQDVIDVDVSRPDWQANLDAIASRGTLHGWSAVDWALFHRSLPADYLPPFSVNLPGWDGWLLWKFKTTGRPIVDATPVFTALHQEHDDQVRGYRKNSVWRDDPRAREELRLAGGFGAMMSIREADLVMRASGLGRPAVARRVLGGLSRLPAWQNVMKWKRQLQQRVVLR